MKKIVTLLIIAALAAALCISLVACDDSGSDKRPGGGGSFNPGGNGSFGELDTSEEIYGFSAASAGMLISAMNDGSAASLATSAADATAPDATAPDTDPDAGVTEPDTGVTEPVTPVVDPVTEELDGYMALVESLLSDGGFTVTTEASDRADYDVKSVITYRDMHGNTLGYTMYYNETLIPDFDDDDDDDDWEDRFEQEEEYAIEGIMIIDGIEYRIHGERSTARARTRRNSSSISPTPAGWWWNRASNPSRASLSASTTTSSTKDATSSNAAPSNTRTKWARSRSK